MRNKLKYILISLSVFSFALNFHLIIENHYLKKDTLSNSFLSLSAPNILLQNLEVALKLYDKEIKENDLEVGEALDYYGDATLAQANLTRGIMMYNEKYYKRYSVSEQKALNSLYNFHHAKDKNAQIEARNDLKEAMDELWALDAEIKKEEENE